MNTLAWVHSLAGLKSLTSKPIVQSKLQNLKRIWCKPVQKRKPIIAEILANLRIAAFSLLALMGFLRFDEAIQLKACEISITTDMAKISLPQTSSDRVARY